VDSYIATKRISEVVHFTTNKGLLGMSFTQRLLPRSALDEEQLLEFILQRNAETRRDPNWFGYVNLSINQINRRYFAASAIWHPKLWWAILAFDPSVLEQTGVYFVNTNNGWRSGVSRRAGLLGLKMLFEEDVSHGGKWHDHRARFDLEPTCPQAEVLYPGAIPLSNLRRVYVRDSSNYREACSYLTFLPWEVPVVIDEARFAAFDRDPCEK